MSDRKQTMAMGPVLLLLWFGLILSVSSHGGNPESAQHSIMLERFPSCQARWEAEPNSSIEEENYRCEGESLSLDRGTIYHSYYARRWTAYAWGIDEKDFATREEAKKYVETQIAFWLRPKAPWWKFWREFADV